MSSRVPIELVFVCFQIQNFDLADQVSGLVHRDPSSTDTSSTPPNLSFRYGKPQKVLCITWAAKLRALGGFSYSRLPHSVSRTASRPHGVPQSVMFTVRSDLFLPLHAIPPDTLHLFLHALPNTGLGHCNRSFRGAWFQLHNLVFKILLKRHPVAPYPRVNLCPHMPFPYLRSSKSRHCSRPFPLTRSCCRAITVWRQHDIPTAFLAAPSINSLVTSSSFFFFCWSSPQPPLGCIKSLNEPAPSSPRCRRALQRRGHPQRPSLHRVVHLAVTAPQCYRSHLCRYCPRREIPPVCRWIPGPEDVIASRFSGSKELSRRKGQKMRVLKEKDHNKHKGANTNQRQSSPTRCLNCDKVVSEPKWP